MSYLVQTHNLTKTFAGYVIYAMESCGFKSEDIQRVVSELHYVFDMRGVEEAEEHYQNSHY